MPFTNLTLERNELIGTLTLNRPEKLNAMTPQLIGEFAEAITQIEQDAEIKVVIIRGAGRAFSTGYDLTGGSGGGSSERFTLDDDQRFLQRYVEHWLRLRDLPKPVISMVHGYCLAGATQLCVSTDIIFVAEDAQLGFPSIPAVPAMSAPSGTGWSVRIAPNIWPFFLAAGLAERRPRRWALPLVPFQLRVWRRKPMTMRGESPGCRRKSFAWKNSQSTVRWICGASGSRSRQEASSTPSFISGRATKRSAKSRRSADYAVPSSGTRKNSGWQGTRLRPVAQIRNNPAGC